MKNSKALFNKRLDTTNFKKNQWTGKYFWRNSLECTLERQTGWKNG